MNDEMRQGSRECFRYAHLADQRLVDGINRCR